jgi:hypothetical protein
MQILYVCAAIYHNKLINMEPALMNWTDADRRFKTMVDELLQSGELFLDPDVSIESYPILRTLLMQAPNIGCLGAATAPFLNDLTSPLHGVCIDLLRKKFKLLHWSFMATRHAVDINDFLTYVIHWLTDSQSQRLHLSLSLSHSLSDSL